MNNFGYQPQYQSPFLPQYQPKSMMVGKVVNDFSQITANDIPMDGSVAVFPLSDYSKIMVRRWEANGTISSLEYAPFNPQVANSLPTQEPTPNSAFNDDRIGIIEERIEKLEKSLKARTKKEASDES